MTFRRIYSSLYLLVVTCVITTWSCVIVLFTWVVEKLFFSVRIVQPWSKLPPFVINSPSVAIFTNRLDACWETIFGTDEPQLLFTYLHGSVPFLHLLTVYFDWLHMRQRLKKIHVIIKRLKDTNDILGRRSPPEIFIQCWCFGSVATTNAQKLIPQNWCESVILYLFKKVIDVNAATTEVPAL